LASDIRPQEFRHPIETPTLRDVNIQRLFGSQRSLKTVEDFTEFEQRAEFNILFKALSLCLDVRL